AGTTLLPATDRGRIQHIMTAGAGVLRSAHSLTRAADRLAALTATAAEKHPEPGVDTWETANLHLVAQVLVAAALRREETRGCHWREDHPGRDDAVWRRHIIVALDGAARPDAQFTLRTTQTTGFPAVVAPPKEQQ
ncbi:L-aspartate oxidase, partial [Streptomyces sp. B15]|nr:L-aspartate oxidase [Streptomyces sp. B15]